MKRESESGIDPSLVLGFDSLEKSHAADRLELAEIPEAVEAKPPREAGSGHSQHQEEAAAAGHARQGEAQAALLAVGRQGHGRGGWHLLRPQQHHLAA